MTLEGGMGAPGAATLGHKAGAAGPPLAAARRERLETGIHAGLSNGAALLFSGDFLMPGRLLINDRKAFQLSAVRILDYLHTRPISHILGGHIELNASDETPILPLVNSEAVWTGGNVNKSINSCLLRTLG